MTTVISATSADVGATSLSASASALIYVLDSVLVNGFNSRTISSITVTSSVGTAITTASHGYEVNHIVEQAGATPSGLNGRFRVLTVPSSNTYTFACPGVVDGAATGSMSAKRAAAGWTKLFSGTDKAAYRSGDPSASQCVFRLENATSWPSFRAYESMSDVDTGTNPFPTVAQSSGGVYFASAFSGTPAWEIAADAKTCHITVLAANQMISFGDYVSPHPAEVLSATLMAWVGYGFPDRPWVPRSDNGSLPALRLDINVDRQGSTTYPSPLTGGCDFSQVQIFSPACHRGVMRGAYFSEQALSHNQTVASGLPGRVMIARVVNGRNVLIDTTGPW